MPRNKKIDNLTDEQVFNVIEFARQMYNAYPDIFTPDLVNSRLKDVNMNPLTADDMGIEAALKDPKNNEYKLRGYSEFFEYTNNLYKRMLYYLGNMLSFDVTYTCTNASPSDYVSKQYKKDEQKVKDFLDRLDIKNEFKKVLRQMVRQDTVFTVFRDDGEKYIFQELPIDYCKITGRSEWSWLFDFDMMWFISNPGVSIDMYPPVFRKYYKRIMDDKNNGYNPAQSLNQRNGEWVYWVQTSPNDNFFAFKFNQEQAGQVPLLAAMFSDAVLAPTIRKLQTNKYIIEASRIMMALIPMQKDSKGGNVKDMMALNPETAGKFANLVRQGLPEPIKFAVGPWDDVKAYDFHTDNSNMLADYNKNMSAMSGINSRLLYATDKMTAEETRNSISVDSYMMTGLYGMFNNFLEYQINKRTSKFRFKFMLEGTEFDMDKQNRLETSMTLAQSGIVLPHKIASALGMLPQDLERQLEMANASGFIDKLMPILNAYTTSNKGGRPESKNPSDSAMNTRDNASNIERGGKI